jgi:hypothetical protein
VIQQQLEDAGIGTQISIARRVDIDKGSLIGKIAAMQPTHIVSVTPFKRVIGQQSSIEWLVQVDQKEQMGSIVKYPTAYKMTFVFSICSTGTLWGIERHLKCFKGWTEPMIGVVRKKGF